jgi:hypothetical protein
VNAEILQADGMFKRIFEGRREFKARSPDRDLATDLAAIGKVAEALDGALSAMQAEQVGLSRRVEEATAIASLAVGNDSDEYISREPTKNIALQDYENEMKRGRDRLRTLEQNIADLRFVRAVLHTRFPNLNSSQP